MAHKPRLIESLSTDFTRFMDDLHEHFWSDGTLDPKERDLLVRGERKKGRMRHINATDAFVEHVKRLDVDDEITYYGNSLAADANLRVVRLDEVRARKDKIVPFPGKHNKDEIG